MMYSSYYPGYGFFGPIFMIIVWGLIIFAIIMFVRMMAGHQDRHGSQTSEDSAMRILKERYAKGEIDKKEYEEKKNDLG